ncbi:MAG: DUF2617 family protein [Solirubrobacteraceae bacterium]
MLIEVSRPYVDVSAGDLSLTLGAAPAPAIEILRVMVGGYAIELRLLGCSHQALVEDAAELSETVACVPGVAGSLPRRRTDGRYSFRAQVERHRAEAYAARAAAVLASVGEDPRALAGVFAAAPGAGGAASGAPLPAFTALAAHPSASGDGIAWTTWHGYPQSGELVVTSSTLKRAA